MCAGLLQAGPCCQAASCGLSEKEREGWGLLVAALPGFPLPGPVFSAPTEQPCHVLLYF